MNLSAPFVRRPVATTLLTIGATLVGIIAFQFLPVASLPQVEFPTINVSATLPGASPETMASSVAAPLERQFTRIAGVTEMTSTSTIGGTNVTLQFELNRNIDGAARDVQAAINAARADLPPNLPLAPSYRKVNPSDGPILILALTSELVSRGQMYDAASSILQQKLSQVEGVGQVAVGEVGDLDLAAEFIVGSVSQLRLGAARYRLSVDDQLVGQLARRSDLRLRRDVQRDPEARQAASRIGKQRQQRIVVVGVPKRMLERHVLLDR